MKPTATLMKPETSENVKAFNPELREQLAAYKERTQATNESLARELGKGTTAVTKYLLGKPVGDVESLEAAIVVLLQEASKRDKTTSTADNTISTEVTERVNFALDIITSSGVIGFIFGEAGVGKTSSIDRYLRNHPTALKIDIFPLSGSRWEVQNALWELLKHGRDKQGTARSRFDLIVERLRGSKRLLILDNAHFLDRTGRDFIVYLKDRTDIPIALVGNPEVIEAFSQNDQAHSRLQFATEVTLKSVPKTLELAQHVLKRAGFDQEEAETLASRGAEIARYSLGGHLRTLDHMARLAVKLRAFNPGVSAQQAFEAAWQTSIRATAARLRK